MRARFRSIKRGMTLFSAAAILFTAILATACKKKVAPYPDLSNPKATAVTFARAMETGDVKIAQDASLAGGMEVDLVEAMTRATHSLKQLGNLTKAKYGDADGQMLRVTGAIDASAALAAGDVAFDGDERATVTPQEGVAGKAVVPVQRTEDGSWKVDIGALIKGDDVTHSIPLLQAVTVAADDVSEKVKAGKYANAGEVKRALQARILEVAAQTGAPTTLPTTLPTLSIGGG